jgi:voltage-gated potassium channel
MNGVGTQPAGPNGVHPSRRVVVHSMVRVVVSIVVLLGVYYLLPMDRHSDRSPLLGLGIALVAIIFLLVFQLRSIIESPYPGVRAIEALAVSVPLLVLTFASTYFVIGQHSAGAFTESMTRTDALYFTVTTFATVGFGDITPKSQGTRALVTFQMFLDLLVLGVGLRLIVAAVQRGRGRSL